MGRDFDHTWSEFQQVSSSPSNINFLPNCFTSRFRTELTLKQYSNIFLLILWHLYKILLIRLTWLWPLRFLYLSRKSVKLHCPRSQPSSDLTAIFVSKFPTHYRQFRARHHLRSFVFHQMDRGQSAFFAECTKTQRTFWKEYPLLFFDLLVSGPWAANEGGSGFVSPFIERG